MNIPSSSQPTKRSALLVASPPETTSKKTKTHTEDECAICEASISSKMNPLQKPNQDTWNNIAAKAQEWKGLGTKHDDLHEKIQVDAEPSKIHKLCRLEIVGQKLTRALDTHNKSVLSEKVGEAVGIPTPQINETRTRSSRIGLTDSTCVICTKTLEGKAVRSKLGGRSVVKYHRLETADAWKTFSKAAEYVEDEQTKKRLQALVTFCDNDGGILKAAALDIRYHKDCWKTYCRPVYNQKVIDTKNEELQQRLRWIKEKQTEAFNQLCEYIVECLDINKEVYTLRDLLYEYEQIQRDMMITNDEIRNTCEDKRALRSLREKLETHFGKDIGFHSRYRRNESSIVFFPKARGSIC